jgi:hypothetical protein
MLVHLHLLTTIVSTDSSPVLLPLLLVHRLASVLLQWLSLAPSLLLLLL